jgi:hypothetical protein
MELDICKVDDIEDISAIEPQTVVGVFGFMGLVLCITAMWCIRGLRIIKSIVLVLALRTEAERGLQEEDRDLGRTVKGMITCSAFYSFRGVFFYFFKKKIVFTLLISDFRDKFCMSSFVLSKQLILSSKNIFGSRETTQKI